MYEVIQGGVTAAKGFMAASTAAGIKYKNRPDMAMIYSTVPCRAAGTFTTRRRKRLYRKRGNGLLRPDGSSSGGIPGY